MAFNWKDILINWVLPLVVTKGEQELLALLQKLHDANVSQYTQLVTGAYPLIDIQLENFTKTTGTKIDDDIVTKIKKVLENSAAANGITLQNLDAGTIGD